MLRLCVAFDLRRFIVANIGGTLEYQILDDNGLVNPMTIYVLPNTAKTLAELQTAVDTLTPLVSAVIDGGIQKITLSVDLTIAGGATSPAAESNNQEGGLLTFHQANSKYAHSIFVPNFKDSLSVQGVIANSGATAALTAELAGSTTATMAYASPYGNVLTAFERARTVFRRFAKQLARAASGRHNA